MICVKDETTNTTWLTDISQVPNVNDESLKRALISLDGCGQKIKTAALEELLKRIKERSDKALVKEAQEIINAKEAEINAFQKENVELRGKVADLKSELQGIYDEQAGESL
jgi:polyhydroxyalkanoate synthesis regulator phasin